MKPLLVGEAPSRRTDGGDPFSGSSGERIAALAGIEFVTAAFDVRNVFDRWPGYDPTAGKGSAYSIAQARIKTAEIADEIVEAGYENVIFVGKRVAEAFGYPTDRILEWKWDVDRGFQWAILPHPSGVNRWWNASTHAREAERFLQGAIA